MADNEGIASLAEYMAWVSETEREARTLDKDALFYRGHSDRAYTLEPTVYRKDIKGKTFRATEHQLYEELLRRDPAAFASDRTILERLARMQHYGLPTRLLDLTHSPLIALYFACGGRPDKDGEVIFFRRTFKEVCHPADVPDAALAGIERACDLIKTAKSSTPASRNFFRGEKAHRTEHVEFNAAFQALLDNCIDILDRTIPDDLLTIVAAFRVIEVDLVASFVEEWDKKFADALKSGPVEQLAILRANDLLLKFDNRFVRHRNALMDIFCESMRIKNDVDKSSLWKFFQQFTFFYFVLPPVNSERIRRQQGAFIICPPGKTEHWPLETHGNPQRIFVQGHAKAKILQELTQLGINRSYVFPELAVLADDAKLRFPASLE